MLTFWKTLKYASFYISNGQSPYQSYEESGEAYAKDTGHRRDIQSEKPSTNAGERPDNVLIRMMRDVGNFLSVNTHRVRRDSGTILYAM